MEQVPSVQEAERAVLAVADEWYDLAHAQYVNVDDWRKIAAKMDKAVQTLRKARARAMGV
jgi:hypothetical protein